MRPPGEEFTVPSRSALGRGPWIETRLRWLPATLPAAVDFPVVLASLAAIGGSRLDPGMVVFAVALLVQQVWPELTTQRLRPSAVDDAVPIVKRGVFAIGVVAIIATATGVGGLMPVLQLASISVPALIAGRGISYAAARSLRSMQSSRTLVVGGGEVARRIIAALGERNEYGMEVVGAVDEDPKLDPEALGTHVLGTIEDLESIIKSHRVTNIIVAFSSHRDAEALAAVRAAAEQGMHVWLVPRLFELGGCAVNSEHLWGYPMYKVASPAPARPEWALKWVVDFTLASVALLLTAPILGLIAAAIFIESGRPILYKQERVGRRGRIFGLLKFRTMHVPDGDIDKTQWKTDRARVTRVGRLLRASGVDEAPQLFNVLKGDMSLVGPRPERPFFVDEFSRTYANYDARHRLPAGVTGWSQIHGLRGDTSIEDRAALDNYYIDNWSLGQDLKIIVKTIPTLFRKQEEE